jgi:hypothetical protein
MNTTKLLLVLLLTLCWSFTASSQLKTPDWEMPFYLENGNREKDTVYLSLDTAATWGLDTLFEDTLPSPNGKKFAAYIQPAAGNHWVKRAVGRPIEEGFFFNIHLYNVDQSITLTTHPNKLADTLHGVKNLIWDESLQKYVPDVYKGAQIWIDLSQTGFISPCGFHGGETVAIVGGSPKLPLMKNYPVCYRDNNIFLHWQFSDPGDKFNTILFMELKPMNILGSPLVGIEEFDDKSIEIYPNPVKDNLIISNKKPVDLDLKLYNNLYKEIKHFSIKAFETAHEDLSGLPGGIYLIVIHGDQKTSYKKVIKL